MTDRQEGRRPIVEEHKGGLYFSLSSSSPPILLYEGTRTHCLALLPNRLRMLTSWLERKNSLSLSLFFFFSRLAYLSDSCCHLHECMNLLTLTLTLTLTLLKLYGQVKVLKQDLKDGDKPRGEVDKRHCVLEISCDHAR
jgi:hypothetical protein